MIQSVAGMPAHEFIFQVRTLHRLNMIRGRLTRDAGAQFA
jgi:hypothetical protein